jgi:hypothetical protein
VNFNNSLKSKVPLQKDKSHQSFGNEDIKIIMKSEYLPPLSEKVTQRSLSQEVPKPQEEPEVNWDNKSILLNIAEDQSETVKLRYSEFKKLNFVKFCPNIVADIIEYLTNISIEKALY